MFKAFLRCIGRRYRRCGYMTAKSYAFNYMERYRLENLMRMQVYGLLRKLYLIWKKSK
jgi:hypothetical protein